MNKKITIFAILSFIALVYSQGTADYCITCTSAGDLRCLNPSANNLNGTQCTRAEPCFAMIRDDRTVERGCVTALGGINCDSETCQTCTGPSCNQDIFPRTRLSCHTCTGPPGSNCSGTISNINPTVCQFFQADDQCFISRQNGDYQRGCRSALATGRCAEGVEPCHFCSGNGCNSGDYNSGFSISSGAKIIAFVAIFILTIFK